jgi:hypothetical protein
VNIERLKSGSYRITKTINGVRYRRTVKYKPTKEEAEKIISEEISNPSRKIIDIQKWHKKKDVFVYFAKNETNGFTKIGVTCNVSQRMNALITACGAQVTPVCTMKCTSYKDAFALEKFLHMFFAKLRIMPAGRSTEWFKIKHPELAFSAAMTSYNNFVKEANK